MINYNHVLGFVLISIVAGSIQFYHKRYIIRSDEAHQAQLYLKSDVCKDSKLRVKVSKYQECAQAEYELAISPSTRALYDVLEFYSVCGSEQKRCEAVVSWVQQNKIFLMTSAATLVYGAYQWLHHEWQMQKLNRVMNTHLLPVS